MRGVILFTVLFFFGFLVWRITERLSPDALGMATGVILGVLAALPVALILLAASRRPRDDGEDESRPRTPRGQLGMQGHQPPVIILSGFPQGMAQPATNQLHGGYGPSRHSLPAMSEIVDSREFHVIGEEDGGVEEW